MHVSLQINARWIVSVDRNNTVLENHAVIIQDDIIIDILPQAEAAKYHPLKQATLNDHALMPGFINAHTHSAMSLLKGLADDTPLDEWLNKHIWPAETALANADFVKDGTELAIAEMIRGGTTCFNDMYFFIGQAAGAAQDIGMRCHIGIPIIDFPTRWAKNLGEYISKGLAVRDKFKKEPLVNFSFAPHAPYSVSDDSFKTIKPLLNELALPMHIHLHETQAEVQQSLSDHNIRPIDRLEELGLLGPDLMAVHMTELSDQDIQKVARYGVHVIHCPESNLKLASGFCPVSALLEAGVNVALGTDGAASNNDIDMLGEMRTAAFLAKSLTGKANALPAYQAIRMATINGAKALGLADKIGSLEIGKQADIIAINLNHVETQPVYDVMSSIVYSANRSQVTDTWVAGKNLMKGRQLRTIDESALIKKAQSWQQKVYPFHHPSYKAV